MADNIRQSIKGNNNTQQIIETQINNYIFPSQKDEKIQKENFLDQNAKSFIIKKSLLNEFTITRQSLLFLVIGGKKPQDASGLIDSGFSSFLSVLLCNSKFDLKVFSDTKTLILSKHEQDIKPIIEKRLDCIADYWQGNNSNIEDNLKEIINEYKDKKIVPNWIINDVAIDLRNQIFTNNSFTKYYDNLGQKTIDDSIEGVYFPNLDRLSNNLRNSIIKIYRDLYLENPYSSSTTSIECIFDDLAYYYCIALYYGSLTHLLIVKNLLQELLYVLFINQKDIRLFEQLIRVNVLLHDDKKLEDIVRSNKGYLLNFIDYSKLITAFSNIPNEKDLNLSKLSLLKHFGLLISNDDFNSLSGWMIDFTKSWIRKPVDYWTYKLILKDTILSCSVRLNIEDAFTILYDSLTSIDFRIIEFGCNIFDCINIKELNIEKQILIKNTICKLINNDQVYKGIPQFNEKIVINFCQHSDIDTNEICQLIEQKDKNFYDTIFSLNVIDKDSKSFIKHIDRYTAEIKQSYSCDKNGVILVGRINPCLIIEEIIVQKKILLTELEIEKLVIALDNLLFSPKELLGDKYDCLSLIITLIAQFPYNFNWKKYLKKLNKNKDKIFDFSYNNFFDKKTKLDFEFCYLLMNHLIEPNRKNGLKLWTEIHQMQKYGKIISLKMIGDIFDSKNYKFIDSDIQSIIQIAITLSYDNERDICYYSTKILCSLIDSKYCECILEQLSLIMDYGNVFAKKIIVKTLLQFKDNTNEIIQRILVKASMENNFYIRNLIKP